MQMRNVLASTGLGSVLILGGLAAPAQAAPASVDSRTTVGAPATHGAGVASPVVPQGETGTWIYDGTWTFESNCEDAGFIRWGSRGIAWKCDPAPGLWQYALYWWRR
jgi:hypothetical protein